MTTENLKITQAQEESIEQFGREHSERLQFLSRSLLSTLYMLIRSVKMYEPDNSIFRKPLNALLSTANEIIGADGKLELVGVKDSFYLNNMLVKVDHNAIDNVRYLVDELRERGVGGFTLTSGATVQDLKNFVCIFSKDQLATPEEDGLAGHKLVNMKVTRWTQLKERTQGDPRGGAPVSQKVDRKKYGMTVYARAVFYVRKYMEAMREGRSMDTSRALRIVQDLVDVSFDQKSHFLGMSTLRTEADYLVYHQVNVCLMTLVFGAQVGLTKPQLRELGYIALFHDGGLACLRPELLEKKGFLSPEEREEIKRANLYTVRGILRGGPLNRSALQRVIATYEHKMDYGTPVRDAHGRIQHVLPRGTLGVYARILAICDTYDALTSRRPFREPYSPPVALSLMWNEVRHRFDPELLQVFMKVMAVAPTKKMGNQVLSLDGA